MVAHSVFCVLGLQGTYHGPSAALEFAVMGLQVSLSEHFATSFSLVHCVT
jgi:hypothetical protein